MTALNNNAFYICIDPIKLTVDIKTDEEYKLSEEWYHSHPLERDNVRSSCYCAFMYNEKQLNDILKPNKNYDITQYFTPSYLSPFYNLTLIESEYIYSNKTHIITCNWKEQEITVYIQHFHARTNAQFNGFKMTINP